MPKSSPETSHKNRAGHNKCNLYAQHFTFYNSIFNLSLNSCFKKVGEAQGLPIVELFDEKSSPLPRKNASDFSLKNKKLSSSKNTYVGSKNPTISY